MSCRRQNNSKYLQAAPYRHLYERLKHQIPGQMDDMDNYRLGVISQKYWFHSYFLSKLRQV